MIEQTASSPALQADLTGKKQPARDDIAQGFSFAAAMTALEGRAARSLETFGAAPRDAAAFTNRVSAETQTVDKQTTAAPQKQAPQGEQAANSQTRSANTATPPNKQAEAAPQQPPTAPAHPLPLVQPHNAAASALPSQQPAPSAARVEATAMRNAENVKAQSLKAPRAPAPAQPQQPTAEFARLLAKRLDGGRTSFELRLDPPELGRVEAHLKTGDDGKAVLALKFENQTALDLFARDEAGLRAALMSSGFDLGGDRLAFALADDPAVGANAEPAALIVNDRYEPGFLAAYSSGAVDLHA